MAEPVLVKRYGGSRLYDTVRGCYLSAATLRSWRKRAIAFVVRDALTDADITHELLA